MLAGNPYHLILSRRRFREARLRAYIVRQHRAGRRVADIAADPYVRRYASPSLLEAVIGDPRTIRALVRDVCDEIESYGGAL